MPHRFVMISGVFFGVAFGIGGLGAAVLGRVADHMGMPFVYQVCAFLPAIGLLAVFLPKMPKAERLSLVPGGYPPRVFVNTLLAIVAGSPFFAWKKTRGLEKKYSQIINLK